MAADSITEVTSQSWFGRLGGAIKGVLIGIVLFLAAFPLLFWNEGRAVKTHKDLEQGNKDVVSIANDKVDGANEGKLVHLSGLADTDGTLTDDAFAISAKALRLRRDVEMYQWQESSESKEKKKLGGGTETTTTYSYAKTWSSKAIESGSFKEQEGHQNPGAMAYNSQDWNAADAKLGAFRLIPSMLERINEFRPITVAADTPVPSVPGKKVQLSDNGFYVGFYPASPQVGDLKISFKEVPSTEISVVAAQTGDSFSPFKGKAGTNINMLETGKHDAAEMFAKAEASNKMMTWILRAVGVIVMTIGLSMVFRPLSVAADLVPFIGSIVGAGTTLVALLISAVLSLITIAIAWVVYRPVIGITLLVVAVAIAVFLGMKLGKAKAKQKAAA